MVAGNADANERQGNPTVRAKPWKINAGNVADGADANPPNQSPPEELGSTVDIPRGAVCNMEDSKERITPDWERIEADYRAHILGIRANLQMISKKNVKNEAI
jgi:hypothetical protein